MSKYDYLHALYKELIEVDIEQRSAIMRDVENKFRDAEDQGLSELSVTDVIGSPAEYAASILSPSSDDEATEAETLEAPEETIEAVIEETNELLKEVSAATADLMDNIKDDQPSIDLSESLIIGHDTELHKARDLVDPEDLMDESTLNKSNQVDDELEEPLFKEVRQEDIEKQMAAMKEEAVREAEALLNPSKPDALEPQVQEEATLEPLEQVIEEKVPQPVAPEMEQPKKKSLEHPVQVKTNQQQVVRRRRPQTPTKYREPQTPTKKVYTTPNQIRKQQSANHPIKMMAIAFGMFLFNATFALGPFVAVWAIVIAFVATGFALAIAGAAILVSALLSIPMVFVSVPIVLLNHPILLFCLGFLVLGIGGLLSIATIYSVRFFGMLTARYAGWNIRLIRGY